MKFNKKTFIVSLMSLMLISSVGYGIAFGYGGGGGGGGTGGSIINGLWNGVAPLGSGTNAPVITPAPAPVTTGRVLGVSTFAFNSDLKLGASGDDVTALQEKLIAEGHLIMPAGVAKGYFGSLTKASLVKYQIAKGIVPASGYFGPITRKAISNSSGLTSAQVTAIISLLQSFGADAITVANVTASLNGQPVVR
jgi:peptidoglycan hydrolase-like protein with peptidoglycan-binding domain